jgi:hypothetical protein
VIVLLAGLPTAVWLDLHSLSEAALRRQASDLNSVITSILGRLWLPNYKEVPGAIPIPCNIVA